MEIGIDIENNMRFKNMDEKKLIKIFTTQEIAYAKKFINYFEHLCSFWCVKEAFIKATKNKMLSTLDIEVSHNTDGSPFVIENKKIKNSLIKCGCSQIKISISHSKDYSTAVCLIY